MEMEMEAGSGNLEVGEYISRLVLASLFAWFSLRASLSRSARSEDAGGV
jgi:hypothetical protein